jgi:hypothetical protein
MSVGGVETLLAAAFVATRGGEGVLLVFTFSLALFPWFPPAKIPAMSSMSRIEDIEFCARRGWRIAKLEYGREWGGETETVFCFAALPVKLLGKRGNQQKVSSAALGPREERVVLG